MRFISARGRSGRSGKWRSPWRWPQQQRRGCRRRGLRRPDMRRPLHHCNGRRRHCHGLWRGHWQHRSLHLQLAVLCHRQVHRHRAERRSAARLQRRVERHRGMRQHGQGQQQRPYPPGNVQGKTAHHRANVGAKTPKTTSALFELRQPIGQCVGADGQRIARPIGHEYRPPRHARRKARIIAADQQA